MNKRWPYKSRRRSPVTQKEFLKLTSESEPVAFYREEDTKMKRFWDLLKESIIIRGTIALALTATACYLAITGQDIPDWLYAVLGTVIGSFFGSKSYK